MLLMHLWLVYNVVAHQVTYGHGSQTMPTLIISSLPHASTAICTSITTRRVKLPSSTLTSVTCSASWWMAWRTATVLTGMTGTRRRARPWQACPTPQAPHIKPQSTSKHYQSCPLSRSRSFRNTRQCTIMPQGTLSSALTTSIWRMPSSCYSLMIVCRQTENNFSPLCLINVTKKSWPGSRCAWKAQHVVWQLMAGPMLRMIPWWITWWCPWNAPSSLSQWWQANSSTITSIFLRTLPTSSKSMNPLNFLVQLLTTHPPIRRLGHCCITCSHLATSKDAPLMVFTCLSRIYLQLQRLRRLAT